MKKSFTDNHNIRKSFGKIPDLVNMPNLLEIQKNSYDLFLQKNVKSDEKLNNLYQSLKVIKKKIDHTDVSFTPDEKFSDIISFTSEI